MEEAMRAFYRGKFPQMTDAELDQLMAEETWMTGADCKARGMVCELVPSDVRAAACVTRRHFKHMPEAAAKFMEIHDAQPAADAPQPEAATEPVAAAAPQGEPVAAAQPEAATEPQAENWEARYKGAMRKMSEKAEELARMRAELAAANHSAEELRAALESSNAALAASNATMESAKAQIEDLNSQLGACRGDLEKAKADLSGVTERAEKAEKELARKGEQLSTLEKAHALLTAGVLKPGGETVTSASGRTPEEREAIRKAAKKNRR
jgi:DNA repair exonuclease SbcCD ATPase subunit